MPQNNIPVSVIVVTRNEESRIASCLGALQDFDDVWVVDSNSEDQTQNLAQQSGAKVVNFVWDGAYPKKRQWCLDTLALAYDWVLFVDADEIVTPALVQEIRALDFCAAGYFVRGKYMWLHGDKRKMLRFGLCNNKMVLFDRRKIVFPVVDDLDVPGMGEIEGHYQPVLKPDYADKKIRQLRNYMVHHVCDDVQQWHEKHMRYAAWEAGMNAKDSWPDDPVLWRRLLKCAFRAMPGRGAIAFVHSFIVKGGFLDGKAGYDFACARAQYYAMISVLSKTNKTAEPACEVASSMPERL